MNAPHWHADLELHFRRSPRGCRLVASHHEGPLYVQRPFYPEGPDLAHVYLLHPPGGLVSGDRLRIALNLERHSKVLCTTPGAARIYRARHDRRPQEQTNLLQLAPGAALEWFPQETIVFPDAQANLETHVELDGTACFSGWEITVLGLPANGEAFQTGHLRQVLRIRVAGLPVLIEQLLLNGGEPDLRQASPGLRSLPACGVFVCGPFSGQRRRELDMTALRQVRAAKGSLCGITQAGDFLVGRFLGTCAQEARRCFLAWWQLLRPLLLQRPACAPAIWST